MRRRPAQPPRAPRAAQPPRAPPAGSAAPRAAGRSAAPRAVSRLNRPRAPAQRPGDVLLDAVALLTPRVAAMVVAVALPEAELVVLEHLQAPDPLRRLPQVEVRDQEPCRTAVIGLKRRAVGLMRD